VWLQYALTTTYSLVWANNCARLNKGARFDNSVSRHPGVQRDPAALGPIWIDVARRWHLPASGIDELEF
jgi:hypothetical protein